MARTKGRSKKIDKKPNKLKPMKIAALIISAIQELKETKGSTPNKITGYISYNSNLPETRVKRQVNSVLKRGVEYGILRRYRGQYFLPAGDKLDRANKVAERFARLPTPVPSDFNQAQEKGESNVRGATAESSRDTRRIKSRKLDAITRQRRAQSLPASPATSMSEISWGRGDSAMRGYDFE